jgi:hypothetical protein
VPTEPRRPTDDGLPRSANVLDTITGRFAEHGFDGQPQAVTVLFNGMMEVEPRPEKPAPIILIAGSMWL